MINDDDFDTFTTDKYIDSCLLGVMTPYSDFTEFWQHMLKRI